MAWRLPFRSDGLHCGVYGTATLMTQHENQAGGQSVDSKLDASEALVVEHIARDSNNEQISQAFIKDDFGRHARIGTTEDYSKRVLTLRQLCPSFGGLFGGHSQRNYARIFIAVFRYVRSLVTCLMGMLRVPCNETTIAFLESQECFCGRNHWSIAIDGLSSSGEPAAAE